MNVDFDGASMATSTMHAGVSGRVSHEQAAPPQFQQNAKGETGALESAKLASKGAVRDEKTKGFFSNSHAPIENWRVVLDSFLSFPLYFSPSFTRALNRNATSRWE